MTTSRDPFPPVATRPTSSCVHRVAALLDRWWLGIQRCRDYYLDDTFRVACFSSDCSSRRCPYKGLVDRSLGNQMLGIRERIPSDGQLVLRVWQILAKPSASTRARPWSRRARWRSPRPPRQVPSTADRAGLNPPPCAAVIGVELRRPVTSHRPARLEAQHPVANEQTDAADPRRIRPCHHRRPRPTPADDGSASLVLFARRRSETLSKSSSRAAMANLIGSPHCRDRTAWESPT